MMTKEMKELLFFLFVLLSVGVGQFLYALRLSPLSEISYIFSTSRRLLSSTMKFSMRIPEEEVPQLKNFDLEEYMEFKPKIDPSLTNVIRALSYCSVSQLKNGLQLIALPSDTVFPGLLLKSSAKYLYCRSFYPELLKTVRSCWRTVLLSNPGTGKSMFQWYYLARLLNPDAFTDALTADSEGRTDPPEVVIRQVGVSHMEIFFIKARVVHKVHIASLILDCFDPATTLYFFEPASSKEEPMWESTRMSILATCSPEISRYKEFCKNGADKLYMPLFTEDELLTIGQHMREQPDFPVELSELYSDDAIRRSFSEYSEIIRYVLPYSQVYHSRIKV